MIRVFLKIKIPLNVHYRDTNSVNYAYDNVILGPVDC